MLIVRDKVTGDVLRYEDLQDFRDTGRHGFDQSVHGDFEAMCDAYGRGDYVGDYESYLGVEIVGDLTDEQEA